MSSQVNSVYLSYNRNTVRRLPMAIAHELHSRGYDVFVETAHFRLLDAPPKRILDEIESHHFFLLILTPASWITGFSIPNNRLKEEMRHAIGTNRTIIVIFAYGLRIEPVRSHRLMKFVLPDDFIAVLMYDTNVEMLVDDLNKRIQQNNEPFACDSQVPAVENHPLSSVQLQAEFLLDQGLTEQYDAELYNRPSSAVSFYDMALNIDSEYAEGHFQRAYFYYWTAFTKWQELTPQEVLEGFNHAIQLSPQEPRYYEKRAFLYERLGNNLSALDDFTTAIQYAPEDSTYYRNRASLHSKLNNIDAALADYSMAIQLKPNEARYYLNRGRFHRFCKQYELALADLKSAITIDANAEYYLWQGYIHADMNDFEQLEKDFHEALKLSKNDAEIYRRQADFYAAIAKYDQALTLVNLALQSNPKDTYALRTKENVLKKMNS